MPVTHWIVALKCEAEALIENLNLKANTSLSGFGFQGYQNREGNHRLVLSGTGKVNSAVATTWLATREGLFSGNDIWINFGIAGNRSSEVGSVFRAARVTDQETNRSWYPPAVWPKRFDHLSNCEVLTVSRPMEIYPEADAVMVEMEAAGFLSAALRFSTAELVQAVKVVSDNEKRGLSKVKPDWVRGICRDALPAVLEWQEGLATVAEEEAARTQWPNGVEELLERLHFTETERHRLIRLARRANTLKRIHDLEKWSIDLDLGSGKAVLKELDRLLADAEGAKNRT